MRIQKLGLQIKAGGILRSSITNPIRALKEYLGRVNQIMKRRGELQEQAQRR